MSQVSGYILAAVDACQEAGYTEGELGAGMVKGTKAALGDAETILAACRNMLAKIVDYVDMDPAQVADREREAYHATGGNVTYWNAITEQARGLLARLSELELP